MLRAMQTQTEFKQRVHANLNRMSPWLTNLELQEHNLIEKQIDLYGKPLIKRLLAQVETEIEMVNGEDSNVRHSLNSEAQAHVIAGNHGNFVNAFTQYNDRRTKLLFELIEKP